MIRLINTPSFYSALYLVASFCREHDIVEVVVPDKLSLFMEKFIYEKLNISSSFDIKVSTLNRFAKKNIEVDKNNQISKIGSIILVHKLLNEHINELEVFKNKAYSFSYAEEIFKTISQLKSSKIGFEEMKQFSSNNAQLNGKIKDLALIYELYEQNKAGKLDSTDMFLMSSMFLDGIKNQNIIFAGFDDFTAIEYSIIERLAINNDVNVVNYFSKSANKHIFNGEMFSQLKNIAYINEIDFKVEDGEIKNDELKTFLENNLFSTDNKQINLDGERIKVFAGKSVSDEIEFVARDIKNKVIVGKKFDDFGVAVFDLESANSVREIFTKYDINFYIDSELKFTNSILYKFFSSVFKYNLEGYNLTNLIDIINSPFFDIDEATKEQLIEKLILIKFRAKIDENTKVDVSGFDELKTFISYLTFNKNDKVSDVKQKIENAILNLKINEKLNFLAENKTSLNDKILLTKSCDVFASLLDDILTFYFDADINSFYDIFISASTITKFNNLPLTIDAVKIVDANNNMEIFSEFYIINCTQSTAPNLKFDCGIILDNEIEQLNFKNKLNPTIAHINKLAKLRLFNLATMFENSLTITYSFLPSELIKEVCAKTKIKNENLTILTNENSNAYIALSSGDYIESLCKFDAENTKLKDNIISNKIFEISNENKNVFDIKTISASQLENYFHCPFNYFLNNILKARPKMENEILSADVGNILHEILFEYYTNDKQVGDIYEFCKTKVLKYIDKFERLKINIDSPIILNLIDEAVRVVNGLNYIDQNTLFKPSKFEYEFNSKINGVNIVGKVDRIDEFNDLIRIVDYKSGRANASVGELYYGNKLQLFLYSSYMEEKLKKRAVGGFYLPLHNAYTRGVFSPYALKGFYLNEREILNAMDVRLNQQPKSDIVNINLTTKGVSRRTKGYKELEATELKNLKDYALKISSNAIDEIKSGYIKPSPSENSNPCEFCVYKHVCLHESLDVKMRANKQVNLLSFKV